MTEFFQRKRAWMQASCYFRCWHALLKTAHEVTEALKKVHHPLETVPYHSGWRSVLNPKPSSLAYEGIFLNPYQLCHENPCGNF